MLGNTILQQTPGNRNGLIVSLPQGDYFSIEYLQQQLAFITQAARSGNIDLMSNELSTAYDSLIVVYLAMCRAQGIKPEESLL